MITSDILPYIYNLLVLYESLNIFALLTTEPFSMIFMKSAVGGTMEGTGLNTINGILEGVHNVKLHLKAEMNLRVAKGRCLPPQEVKGLIA